MCRLQLQRVMRTLQMLWECLDGNTHANHKDLPSMELYRVQKLLDPRYSYIHLPLAVRAIAVAVQHNEAMYDFAGAEQHKLARECGLFTTGTSPGGRACRGQHCCEGLNAWRLFV
jgi:hypothetical protein